MQNNKRKICVVTGSRAEYGILCGLMKEILNDKDIILQIIVTGMHLSKKFGLTYKQIINDQFKIDKMIDIKLYGDKDIDIANSISFAVKGFGKAYSELKPDILVVLGDRYEILAAVLAAVIFNIPIAHLHGGEVTEGANDDMMRHAITKMSFLHFVCHEEYRKRVIQMGESPSRVFNYGSLGVDNIKKMKLLNKQDLENMFKIDMDNTVLVTFHPTTMEKGKALSQIESLLLALEKFDFNIIFTMPNADSENGVIFKVINKFVAKNRKKSKAYAALGQLKYFSLMKYSLMMIGNSSSGIIESPSFKIPVVNIGNRQKGRIIPTNVLNSSFDSKDIKRSISMAMSQNFLKKIQGTKNPFEGKNTSNRITKILKNVDLSNLKKGFNDL